MSLQIVPSACKAESDGSKVVVVLESDMPGPPYHDSFEELTSQAAVQLAQQFATQLGCSPAFLNGNKSTPYAVNSEGIPLEDVRTQNGQPLPQTHPRMQPARYRIDIPIARRLM